MLPVNGVFSLKVTTWPVIPANPMNSKYYKWEPMFCFSSINIIDSLHTQNMCIKQNQSGQENWNKEEKTDLSSEQESTDTEVHLELYMLYEEREDSVRHPYPKEVRRRAVFSISQPNPSSTTSVPSIPWVWQQTRAVTNTGCFRLKVSSTSYHGNSQALPACTHFCGMPISLPLLCHCKEGVQQSSP